jgi:hypothetical protein
MPLQKTGQCAHWLRLRFRLRLPRILPPLANRELREGRGGRARLEPFVLNKAFQQPPTALSGVVGGELVDVNGCMSHEPTSSRRLRATRARLRELLRVRETASV